MPNRLRPTRQNVIDIDYVQGGYNNHWFTVNSPHFDENGLKGNRSTVTKFLSELELHPDDGDDRRTQDQRHLVNENVGLEDVHRLLLTQFRATTPEDIRSFTGLLLQVKYYLERYPDEACTVYQIHVVNGEWTDRRRRLNEHDQIDQLYQGAYPSTGERQGEIYPGDRNIGDKSRLVVQIHKLILQRNGVDVMSNVPTIAIWVPRKMAVGWLVQDENVLP
jgi:hypothetical protein